MPPAPTSKSPTTSRPPAAVPINFNGAGAALTSDGLAPTSFTNDNAIIATASAQIGDESIKSVNDLMLIDHGAIIADGPGVTLTLNTGARTIADQGGLLEAENGAQLVLDSAVDTGVTGVLGGPNSGTIEAGAERRRDHQRRSLRRHRFARNFLARSDCHRRGNGQCGGRCIDRRSHHFHGRQRHAQSDEHARRRRGQRRRGAINLSSAQADVTGGAFTVNETE